MELPEQIYQDLKDALPALEEALKTGVSYGGDLAHRFIMYDIAINIFYILLLAILFGISVYFLTLLRKKVSSEENPSEALMGVTILVALCTPLLGAIFLATFSIGIQAIMKDIYIPEIRIMEVVRDLLPVNNG